jgi:dTDP-4-amino-4,6-dideoxygalactose transaminase
MTPKQIINPLRYIRPFIYQYLGQYRDSFIQKFHEDFEYKNEILSIGRARAGIYLLVKKSIRKDKKRVIMSPYTIPDVVNMVRFAGGEPIFVDFLPKSTNIDLNHLETLISKDVASIILTHYHVNQNDFYKIKKISQDNNIMLFEDCAISLGAKINNNLVGTESDAGVFSFSAFKFLNFLWGGAIVSNNEELYIELNNIIKDWEPLKFKDYKTQIPKIFKYDLFTNKYIFNIIFPLILFMLKKQDQIKDYSNLRIETKKIDHTILSLPSNAAFYEWNRKIHNIKRDLEHRRTIAKIYDNYLYEYFVSKETDKNILEGSCFVNYPIYIGKNRDKIYNLLMRNKFHVGLSLYPNCHLSNQFKDIPGDTKNVTDLVESIISLPTHINVTTEYAEKLAQKVLYFIREQK